MLLIGKLNIYSSAKRIQDSKFLSRHPLLKEFLRASYFFALTGQYNPRLFIVLDNMKLVYLINFKAAYTSIINSLAYATFPELYNRLPVHKLPFKTKLKLSPNELIYFKFSIVRNPFSRVVSFYFNRIKNKKKFPYLFGFFQQKDTFSTIIKKISKIPDRFAENHFKSQYSIIYHRGKPLVDFIGRFENLEEDWEKIRERVPELPKLPKLNVSKRKKDWRSYYTKELADLVYKRYKKDFETWYPNAYKELLDYLKK